MKSLALGSLKETVPQPWLEEEEKIERQALVKEACLCAHTGAPPTTPQRQPSHAHPEQRGQAGNTANLTITKGNTFKLSF